MIASQTFLSSSFQLVKGKYYLPGDFSRVECSPGSNFTPPPQWKFNYVCWFVYARVCHCEGRLGNITFYDLLFSRQRHTHAKEMCDPCKTNTTLLHDVEESIRLVRYSGDE